MNENVPVFDKRALREQLEDAMLRYAMFEHEEAEAEAFLQNYENENSDLSDQEIEAAYSRAYPRFVEGMNRQRDLRQSKEHARRLFPRVGRALAYALLACYLMGTAALAASPEARVYLARFLIHVKDEYTELSMRTDEETFVNVPAGWQGRYYIAYVPAGFVLDETLSGGSTTDAAYTNEKGQTLFFSEYQRSAEANIDTENAVIEYVDIHGSRAIAAEKDGTIRMAWNAPDRYFVMIFDGTFQEAILIARSTVQIN